MHAFFVDTLPLPVQESPMIEKEHTMAVAHSETEMIESLTKFGIPEHMHGGVTRYVLHHIQPGDFLTAVASNALWDAFARADESNIAAMHNWVKWFYNEAPAPCWGSPAKVTEWLNARS